MANGRQGVMFNQDRSIVDERVIRLRAEADRARLATLVRSHEPHLAAWRVTLALALFALAHAVARPPRRDEACADCI